MMTANEARTIAYDAFKAKRARVEMVAHNTIDAIEATIRCDAEEGKFESIFHLYNYHNFISDWEKNVYKDTLIKILETNGYRVKYNHTGNYLEIKFL